MFGKNISYSEKKLILTQFIYGYYYFYHSIMEIITEFKYIHDCIHGYIPISNVAYMIINTPEFQRLRYIKQLGTCIYAFPNANHCRFSHSIGTYHLAGEILASIIKKGNMDVINNYLGSIKELEHYFSGKCEGKYVLDNYVCELVKIAALCHDLGHGPFSHVFDDIYLARHKDGNPRYSHEERSKIILENIISKNKYLSECISKHELEFIKNIIDPNNDNIGFIYQIVSNSYNGIDVDKFDYITRDCYILGLKNGFDYEGLVKHAYISNINIEYPEKLLYEIKKMFDARYSLHKQIYSHKTVISAQIMMTELFEIIDPVLNLSKSVDDMEYFCKLTDEYILNCIDHRLELYRELSLNNIIYYDYIDRLDKAKTILDNLNNHNMYRLVSQHLCDSDNLYVKIDDYMNLDDFDPKYIDKIIIYNTKIGFVSGNKNNPMDNIHSSPYYYTGYKKIYIGNISNITPNVYQEYISMVYTNSKEDGDIEKIKKWSTQINIANSGKNL